MPNFPLAHWLAATVYVARQVPDKAERELVAGLAAQSDTTAGADAGASVPRFGAVALHWLLGLIHLAHGDHARALDEFEQELALENAGLLYSREYSADTWYAIGALRLRQGRRSDAGNAFRRAITRVASHPLAHIGLSAAEGDDHGLNERAHGESAGRRLSPGDAAICQAAQLSLAGRHLDSARTIEDALAQAPAGNAAWTLPLEPLLHVAAHQDFWTRALAQLRSRAS
ncbi:MAG: hypothetical protein EXQ48_05340 [Acidobacteria bacterium]|nr:hypothetical protein [Acidobacteriota bacterium]